MRRATRMQKKVFAKSIQVLYKIFKKQFWSKGEQFKWRCKWGWLKMPFWPEVEGGKCDLILAWILLGNFLNRF